MLREHFYPIYAYCRWADDLADEVGDARKSLELLDWWQEQLEDCYARRVRHPVFVALGETIEQFQIPPRPFLDLLEAFRQDQRTVRYETFDELLGYCRNSAHPVGSLVLYLGQCHEPELVKLSNSICTGLQLVNFCQDVARDWQSGRVYLPEESCSRFGYDEAMFGRSEFNEPFRRLMAFEVERAKQFLLRGRPLIQKVPNALKFNIALYIRGGLAVAAAIRRLDYNVWRRRPTLSKLDKLRIFLSCWLNSRIKTEG